MSMKKVLKRVARTTKQKAQIEQLSETEAEKLVRALNKKEENKNEP